MRLAGHVARIVEIRDAHSSLVGKTDILREQYVPVNCSATDITMVRNTSLLSQRLATSRLSDGTAEINYFLKILL
jgi:hypothetical protein